MAKKSQQDSGDVESAASTLGRLGGLANTAKQQEARKLNAKRAGRPRRICLHCGNPVIGGHIDRALDDTCGAHGWRWQSRAEQFAQSQAPAKRRNGTRPAKGKKR